MIQHHSSTRVSKYFTVTHQESISFAVKCSLPVMEVKQLTELPRTQGKKCCHQGNLRELTSAAPVF